MAPSRNRIAQVDSTDVSTADVSMNEDTEMTDNQGPSNGVTKFGVSAPQLKRDGCGWRSAPGGLSDVLDAPFEELY